MINLPRRRAKAQAPDVRQMGDGDDIGDDAATLEYRPHDVDVKGMPGAKPGIVGDHHIPGRQAIGRKTRQHMLQGGGRRAHKNRYAVGALGHQFAIRIHQGHSQIITFADDCGE